MNKFLRWVSDYTQELLNYLLLASSFSIAGLLIIERNWPAVAPSLKGALGRLIAFSLFLLIEILFLRFVQYIAQPPYHRWLGWFHQYFSFQLRLDRIQLQPQLFILALIPPIAACLILSKGFEVAPEYMPIFALIAVTLFIAGAILIGTAIIVIADMDDED